MAKKILLGLALVIAAFLLLVASRPADFKVERSIVINAPAAKPFAIVNDLHRWNDWSPWAKMDPSMKQTFDGPKTGVGSSTAWEGNDKVGAGKQTITVSQPGRQVSLDLEFYRPMQAKNTVDFILAPEGKGTKVTWAMSGRHNFVSKAFSLVFNMDKMVGGDFEKGLANLKALSEQGTKAAAK